MSRVNQEATAKAQIKRWSKLLDEETMVKLVEGELKATRSPVRKGVYQAWLDLISSPTTTPHPTIEGVKEGGLEWKEFLEHLDAEEAIQTIIKEDGPW